jgi:hypothetical protein
MRPVIRTDARFEHANDRGTYSPASYHVQERQMIHDQVRQHVVRRIVHSMRISRFTFKSTRNGTIRGIIATTYTAAPVTALLENPRGAETTEGHLLPRFHALGPPRITSCPHPQARRPIPSSSQAGCSGPARGFRCRARRTKPGCLLPACWCPSPSIRKSWCGLPRRRT